MCETSRESGHDPEAVDETTLCIRQLNDDLRRTFMGGQILMTPGFSDLPNVTKAKALAAIRSFDNFDEGSDPYGEHDFGSVEVDGQTVWFKVDCYDRNLHFGSPDPADPGVTTRVLTILTPDEY